MLRVLLISLTISSTVAAEDWPQILGPKRDGQSAETKLNWDWSKTPPKVLWSKDVGRGWSSVVVADGRAYLFHRVADEDVLLAFEPATGQELWTCKWPANYRDDFNFDDGPRATPTIVGGVVYLLGANGDLYAVDAKKGDKLWQKKLLKEYGAGKGYFGVACSPLVTEGKVIVNVGGKGASVVAFDTTTGKEIWKVGNDEASYSSPVVAEFNRKKIVVAFTRRGLLGVDLATGQQLFEHFWRSRIDASVNASTPLILDGHIFLTSSYGTGAILFACDGTSIKEVWSNDKSMSCQYATPVSVGEHLIGTEGRSDSNTGALKCIHWKTGEVKWNVPRFGCAGVIAVEGRVLSVTESGELVAVAANPDKFEELGRLRILDGKVRALPALANGLLYARDEKKLVCVRVK